MSLLVQINSTPELLLSDDGTSTSEGRAWRAAIRAVQFTDRIASPIKPLYVPPRMTLRVTSVGVLDLDDLIGKTAQAWQGSGPVFAGYTSILKGRVSERSSQSEATTTLIIEPTLDNPSATYTNDTSSRLSALAEAIATQEAIAYDFDDWKAESDPEMGTAAIEVPAPAADLIAQAAFEDFNDLAIQDDKLTVLTRRPAAPGTQIHIYAAPDARVEIDPFQETVNRLSLVFPDEIRIYEDSTSIGKIGVREQTVQARFIPKSAANLWAARYLHRYAATQVWVSVELGGCWPPGSQFRARWAKPETLHRQYVTDQRYQVRQATYRPADDTTQVRAWRVTTDPGTLQPLTPTRTVDTPGPQAALFEFAAPTIPNLTKDVAIVAGTFVLPLATKDGSALTGETYSVASGLPSWATFTASSRRITGTPDVAGPVELIYKVTDADWNTATLPISFTVVEAAQDADVPVFEFGAPTIPMLARGQAITTGYPFTLPLATKDGSALTGETYSVASGLPSWATFTASTRRITGTPDLAGSYELVYKVVDADGNEATLPVSFVVLEPDAVYGQLPTADPGEFVFGNPTIPTLTKDSAITAGQFVLPEATRGGSAVPGVVYSTPLTLPTGLTFTASTRRITGTPRWRVTSTCSTRPPPGTGSMRPMMWWYTAAVALGRR